MNVTSVIIKPQIRIIQENIKKFKHEVNAGMNVTSVNGKFT